ncbi:MAG TPA: helix-turn-helix domain-containing protein, partial [Dermatophilaceae bacterium]
MSEDYPARIGTLIREARRHQGLSQSDLAELLGTSQSAVARIEQGRQNLSLEMLARIGASLDSEFVSVGHSAAQHLRIVGGTKLSGAIDVKTSKNAAVALLCASLLNHGRTTFRSLARIEEVNRILEVLVSIGVKARWLPDSNDLEITPPAHLDLARMDLDAARRTRTVIMFLGPLLHELDEFRLPYVGGCDLGTRTVDPHLNALRAFGLNVTAVAGFYEAEVDHSVSPSSAIVLTERGDTVTQNAIMAAARHDGVTVIRNASPNYMVQDVCFFLGELGVAIEGIGSTTLTIHGKPKIDVDVEFSPSEDPIEAMSLLAAAVVTESAITIRRV